MFEIDQVNGDGAKIKVVGVGGGGGNALSRMIASGVQGVEHLVVLGLGRLVLEVGRQGAALPADVRLHVVEPTLEDLQLAPELGCVERGIEDLLTGLSAADRAQVLGAAAERIYRLP